MAGKLVLHIGSTKTGTSAIQSALVRNRDALHERGILVPEGRRDERADAGRVTGGNGRIFHSFNAWNGRDPEKALQMLHARLKKICSDSKCHTVIVSSEALGGYSADDLNRLKPVLHKYFDEIQIVYFVRHMTDHAISQYGEFVKRRQMKRTFSDFAPTYRAPYKSALKAYEAVFDRDTITCVLYDDVRKRVFPALLEEIGIAPQGLESPKVVNRSLTADEIEVFRIINAKGFDRVLVAKIIEDYSFRNPRQESRRLSVPRSSIETIGKNNREVLAFVNDRLRPSSRLLVASNEVSAAAIADMEAEELPLNAEMLMAILESSLRVSNTQGREMKETIGKMRAKLKLNNKQLASRRYGLFTRPVRMLASLRRRARQTIGR